MRVDNYGYNQHFSVIKQFVFDNQPAIYLVDKIVALKQ